MKKDFFINASLVVGSILAVMLVVELSIRDYSAGFENLILKEGGNLVEHHFEGLYQYDRYLGWVPRDHASMEKWGVKVNILENGIRSNGAEAPKQSDQLILAVGDSYVFGDERADNETWPAILERLTSFKVINAGVSSYGFDQIILRAEQMAPQYKPDVLIVSFIYDDILRCSQSVRHGVPKPYFVIEKGKLVLMNSPIPFIAKSRLDWFRSIFGHSYLMHLIMTKINPEYWWQHTEMKDMREVPNNKIEVVKALLDRLNNLSKDGTRVILLVQAGYTVYPTQYIVIKSILDPFLKNKDNKIEVYNLVPLFLKMKQENIEAFESYYDKDYSQHPNVKGDTFVANFLKGILEKE